MTRRVSELEFPYELGVYGGTTPAFALRVATPIRRSGWHSWARLDAAVGHLAAGDYFASSSAFTADPWWAILLLSSLDRDLPEDAAPVSWRWGTHFHGVGEFELAPDLAEARRRQAAR